MSWPLPETGPRVGPGEMINSRTLSFAAEMMAERMPCDKAAAWNTQILQDMLSGSFAAKPIQRKLAIIADGVGRSRPYGMNAGSNSDLSV